MEQRLNHIETALSLWASAIFHRAGMAEGHPLTTAVLRELASTPDVERYLVRLRARVQPDVLSAAEIVERTLDVVEAPVWFRAFLLFKYPMGGRYEPERKVRGTYGAWDGPAEGFVLSGHFDCVTGAIASSQVRRDSVKLVKSAERAFNVRLSREMANFAQAPV